MNLYKKNSRLKYIKNNNPKISIIITVFNGEGYIRPVICSIQNQFFVDLEIIIVDDFSKDNSVKIIKELMKEDSRIILLENTENKGTLYSKSRGVLNAKGKYVITLDQDNLYSSKYSLSILYEESEKYNLDLLGFSSIVTSINMHNLKEEQYINYIETPIIKKPLIHKRFFNIKKGESSTSVCLYLIKTELYKNVIKKIGNEILNRNIDAHDDTIIMFLLSKYANNLKHIKRILHLIFSWPTDKVPALIFQTKNKIKFREMKHCLSFFTYSEALLLFSENNQEDIFIASSTFIYSFLNSDLCKKSSDKSLIKEVIRTCNMFLNNTLVNINHKKIINNYLNKTINNNSVILL